MDSYALGADVGGTTIKLGLFSSGGKLLNRWFIPTHTAHSGRQILPDMAQSILENLSALHIKPEQIAGIGIGVPGPVDTSGVVHGCVNLGWGTVNVAAEMRALLPGIPKVAVGNDANAAALGELWFGCGVGHTSAVLFTLGTGVGGGVVLDGAMVPGFHGAGGEFGHITVNPEESDVCTCGKRGCLEQYASATGLVRMAHLALVQCDTPSLLRGMTELSPVEICDSARKGDILALALLERCGEAIGRVMSFVSGVVDPELYIIGGGMSKAGDILLDPIRKYYRIYSFSASRNTPIVLAHLGSDAGIYGCARMILHAATAF